MFHAVAPLEGRYAIEREAGMATVYLAEDLQHRREVDLKVLRPDLGATGGRSLVFGRMPFHQNSWLVKGF